MKWRRQKIGPSLPPLIDDATVLAMCRVWWGFVGSITAAILAGWTLIQLLM